MAIKIGLHYSQCSQRMLLTIYCHSLKIPCCCAKLHPKNWAVQFSTNIFQQWLAPSFPFFLPLRSVTAVYSGDKIPVLAYLELIAVWSFKILFILSSEMHLCPFEELLILTTDWERYCSIILILFSYFVLHFHLHFIIHHKWVLLFLILQSFLSAHSGCIFFEC